MPPTAAKTIEQGGQSILYLSYDGMSDPLGQSQVLPYLSGLTRHGHRITLISFEKKSRSAAEIDTARQACAVAGIDWHPLRYRKRPPVLSSVFDVITMRRTAERLHRDKRFDWVHCRSYLPALVGFRMKRRCGTRFLFDMRGFWADERIDGGLWRLANPVHRAVYAFFKRREADFLNHADHVVSLTETARNILLARPDRSPEAPPISVIPCCVDFEAFPAATATARAEARRTLEIAPNRTVAVYLGSIGTWYMLDEMLDCFRVQLNRRPGALFLIITRDDAEPIRRAARAKGIPDQALKIRSASRAEVPQFVAAADYAIAFIRPTFSKSASCPTKLGECLALEIPVLTNGGVGDVARVIGDTGGGVLVDRFDDEAYRDALDRLEQMGSGQAQWREAARAWFDLDQGVERYHRIYIDPEVAVGSPAPAH
jgi:glycosyltransferase involved in cell wall biosynthesis